MADQTGLALHLWNQLGQLASLLNNDRTQIVTMQKILDTQDEEQIQDLVKNSRALLVWARNLEKIAKQRLQTAKDNCPGHKYEGTHVCKICGFDSE